MLIYIIIGIPILLIAFWLADWSEKEQQKMDEQRKKDDFDIGDWEKELQKELQKEGYRL